MSCLFFLSFKTQSLFHLHLIKLLFIYIQLIFRSQQQQNFHPNQWKFLLTQIKLKKQYSFLIE